MAIHWYVSNSEDDFAGYMALSELFEERLTAAEGLIAAMRNCACIERPIYLAVDEWNVWHRGGGDDGLENCYTLEDALVVALQLNAFVRHARSVRMANLAQAVNVLAPIITRSDDLLLQSIFFPFELYSREAGDVVLDAYWEGDTFQGGERTGVRTLDVSATLDLGGSRLTLFIVNRSLEATRVSVRMQEGEYGGEGRLYVVHGDGPEAVNSFENRNAVGVAEKAVTAWGDELTLELEPHSVTGLVLPIT
jgi:alpha-N-arabinofuranosidase